MTHPKESVLIPDNDYWSQYADNADSKYNEEFAKFLRDLAVSLRASSVLEVGCNAGNDLKLFPAELDVHGVDSNEHAISIARKRLPKIDFKVGDITKLPFDDSSVDFVFTHKVLNFVNDEQVKGSLDELFRVSKRYILNCELVGPEGQMLDSEPGKLREVYPRWLNYKVKIISDVEMHEEIDPEKSRFILVRKLV